ncbi:hypothetical protein JCM10908_002683 [Rhodotorula pacifica]|uniref:uncharacterized protein n=1 Tax=Rhodotorula pacifica TaxID=1495444 RepID=UPI00317B24B3
MSNHGRFYWEANKSAAHEAVLRDLDDVIKQVRTGVSQGVESGASARFAQILSTAQPVLLRDIDAAARASHNHRQRVPSYAPAMNTEGSRQSGLDDLLDAVSAAYGREETTEIRHFRRGISSKWTTLGKVWPARETPLQSVFERVVQDLCAALINLKAHPATTASEAAQQRIVSDDLLSKAQPKLEVLLDHLALDPAAQPVSAAGPHHPQITGPTGSQLESQAHSSAPFYSEHSVGHAARLILSPRKRAIYARMSARTQLL